MAKLRWLHKIRLFGQRERQQSRTIIQPVINRRLTREMIKSAAWSEPGLTQKASPTCPPKELSKKIGIQQNERVLVFAGHSGDWAQAIANFADVTYTDLSKQSTDLALRRFNEKGKIKAFKVRPAQFQPRKANLYDWSFSFEPYPLEAPNHTLKFTLLRALLNRRGAKLVYIGRIRQQGGATINDVKPVAEGYGATYKATTMKIKAQMLKNPETEMTFSVITLNTSTRARKRAVFDLKVLKILNGVAKKGQGISMATLAKKTSARVGQVDQSLKRLRVILGRDFYLDNGKIIFSYFLY